MDTDSTTNDAPVSAGADDQTAQPVQPEPVAADTPAEPTTNEEPSTDDNSSWLQAKGIDPSDPEAISKLAEMARNAEKKMHESTQKASDLTKSITESSDKSGILETDPVLERVQRVELALQVENFFKQEGIDAGMRPKMAEYAEQNPAIAALVDSGHISLRDLYNMTKGADPAVTEAARAEGGQEALQKVADKQLGRATQGHATTSSMPAQLTKANAEAWYTSLSPAERADPSNQAKLNAALSS